MFQFFPGATVPPEVSIRIASNGFIVEVRPKGPAVGSVGHMISSLITRFGQQLPEQINFFQQQTAGKPPHDPEDEQLDAGGVAPPAGSPEAAEHHLRTEVQRAIQPLERLLAKGEPRVFVFPSALQMLEFLSELFVVEGHPETRADAGGHSLEGEGGVADADRDEGPDPDFTGEQLGGGSVL